MKQILGLTLVALIFMGASCGQAAQNNTDTTSAAVEENKVVLLTPDLQKIMDETKSRFSTVKETKIINESNDPYTNLGKPGQYTAGAGFWDTRTKYSEEYTDEADKGKWGNDAGGLIEVYGSEEDAKKRADYMQQFVGTTPLTDPGAFKQIKNVVIRASSDLSKSQQDEVIAFFEEQVQR